VGAFQDLHLEQGSVVMAWNAPLLVVVLDIKRVTGPRAPKLFHDRAAFAANPFSRNFGEHLPRFLL
jgi:hypothetical protein